MNEQTPGKSISPNPRSVRTRMIAATGLFGALAIILTTISQGLGLNFPLIPYLQFDFGEIAILMAFLLFGPWPAIAAGVVEFVTLMAIGQNVPIGPILKLLSILSSVGGLWVGTALFAKTGSHSKAGAVVSALTSGIVSRVGIMTLANFALLEYFSGPNGVQGTIGYLAGFFSSILGISLTASNGLELILGFTALFNCIQLIIGFVIAYMITRLPQLRRSLNKSGMAWFESLGRQQQQTISK